jgi:hypothetical protein
LVAVACAAALAALPGCGGDGESSSTASGGGVISAEQFQGGTRFPRNSAAAVPGSTVEPTPGLAPGERGPLRLMTGAGATDLPRPARVITIEDARGPDGSAPVVALAGEPTAVVRPDARPLGKAVVVDSLVGQINGKPVYANQFLLRLDGVLRAAAREAKGFGDFERKALPLIQSELRRQIQDALILAEARSQLTPEERRGLLAFVQRLRENISSGFGGSEVNADEELLRAESKTLDEKVSETREQAIIQNFAQKQLNPRVNVSQRDVAKFYERNYREFNPRPAAVFRLIRVAAQDKAGLDAISEALAAGRPFAEVARMEANGFFPSDGGLVAPRPFDPPYSAAKLWDDPTLNAAAQSLAGPGAFTGPIDFNNTKTWVFLDAVKQEPGRTLEEVQLDILRLLRDKRFREEYDRFFTKVLERGSFTEANVMQENLLLIAGERYLVAEAQRP